MAETVLDALVSALETASQHNSHEDAARIAVLWPDPDEQWRPLIELLRQTFHPPDRPRPFPKVAQPLRRNAFLAYRGPNDSTHYRTCGIRVAAAGNHGHHGRTVIVRMA